MELQTIDNSVDLSASAEKVWAVIGQFGGMWHPLIAHITLVGEGVGQLRMIEMIDGKEIVERLESIDMSQRLYRYTNISGIGSDGLHRNNGRKAEGDGLLSRVASAVSGR